MSAHEYTNHVIAAVIGLIVTALATWFYKVPRLITEKIIEKQQLKAIQSGSKVANIIADLCQRSGALYVHIIRYHNGGDRLKEGHPVNMTVDWEAVGTACNSCANQCEFRGHRVRVQADWQSQPLDQGWFKVVEKTISNKHEPQKWTIEEMDTKHQEIWSALGIFRFKEMFIKHKTKGFYTLGLSFCQRFKGYDRADGHMAHAAKQLINLL